MPSRMPNWKMRANKLADGSPTTRPCRIPSLGSTCMIRTSRIIASADMKLSASSVTAKFVAAAPAFAKLADVAGLEADIHSDDAGS